MSLGSLYIVATPIGNLDDITFRAIEILKSVDFVLCEDVRQTKKLLSHYKIDTKTLVYHQHSNQNVVQNIFSLLKEGKNLALVTDAGTPGISDPGNLLIKDLLECDKNLNIINIPGPCAAISALSISGFQTDKFLFLGFPPNKNKRNKFFQEVADSKYTVVFYESNHRIKKSLQELSKFLNENAKLCVCREMTKAFETIYRGTISEILSQNIIEKGEFVVVVYKM
jgi:16S rRNA (cytidine1402-2'-O)-methyltransferase